MVDIWVSGNPAKKLEFPILTGTGIAFRDLKPNMQYYPIVGMKKPGETLRANFGQEPFHFDIDRMVNNEKAVIQAEIAQAKPAPNALIPADESQFIHQLVSQYLAHDGYVDTAQAFAEEIVEEARALANDENASIPYPEAVEDLDALNRQSKSYHLCLNVGMLTCFAEIRSAILQGDIDKALKHTTAYYPSVLRENENIYFKLRCRKFIEMIRRSNELREQSHSVPTPPSKRSTASTLNNRSSVLTDDYDFEMELDDQLNPPASWDGQHQNDDMGDEDDMEDMQTKVQQQENETLAYGQELQAEFANDPRREVQRALRDTFALIAYENVKQSTLAPLLDVSGRVPVAEELNSAILGMFACSFHGEFGCHES